MSTVKVSLSDHAPVLVTPRLRSTGEGRGRALRRSAHQASLALTGFGVLAQIAYPLLTGEALRIATVLSVLLLAAAMVLHAAAGWGARAAVLLLVAAGGLGLTAETVGVRTGFPFGDYAYANTLGPRLAWVPIVVPLAWTMLAYPCLLLGRRLAPAAHGRALTTALTGGLGLAGWDLFLDPQMIAQGNWAWLHPVPALPGVPGVPLTNYAGWLLVSTLMIAVLDHVLPAGSPAGELTPATLLAWTWLGSVVGNLAFFDRPWVALYGGVVMGSVVLPYLLALHSAHRASEHRASEHRASEHRGSA